RRGALRRPRARRVRLLRIRVARVQADELPRRGEPRLRAARPYDLRDERRGERREAHRLREAAARRRPVLRRQGPAVEAGPGRPHRDLSRQRLVHPLLGLRRRDRSFGRVVSVELRLGPPAARGGRTYLAERCSRLERGNLCRNGTIPPSGDFERARAFENGATWRPREGTRMLQWNHRLVTLLILA